MGVQHDSIDHAGLTGVGVASGTSFPGGPSNNDLFYRTDLDLLFFYDGTRWLTVNLYTAYDDNIVITATFNEGNRYRVSSGGLDYWLVAWSASVFVATTSDGSNHWTIQLNKRNASDTGTSVATFTTAALTANTWTEITTAIGAVVDTSDFPGNMNVQASVKTGSPGNCLFLGGFTYRLIGT